MSSSAATTAAAVPSLREAIFQKLYSYRDETFDQFYDRIAAFTAFDSRHQQDTRSALARGDFTFATPILRLAGTPNAKHYSSCFLIEPNYDNYGETLKDVYTIATLGGGIGMVLSKCPSVESEHSLYGLDGVVKQVHLFNNLLAVAKQSKFRNGNITMFLDVWHADVIEFLDVKNPSMNDRRVLFAHIGLMLNDVFMEKVRCPDDCQWYLFDGADPHVAKLHTLYGEEFDDEYHRLVAEKRYVRKIKAKTLFNKILMIIQRTAEPFILHSDNINKCNMQEHLGKIRGSNLCTEIMQYHDSSAFSACTLGSINVANCVDRATGRFSYERLRSLARTLVLALNVILDKTHYLVEKIDAGLRPLGVGIQGFADALVYMGVQYADGGDTLREIYENIYYAAVEASCEYATETGTVFSSFADSLYARGIFYHQRWADVRGTKVTTTLDWDGLRARVCKHGLANSMFVAQMPTATTALFLENTEGCEPLAPAIDRKKNSFGEFLIYSKHVPVEYHRELEAVGGLVGDLPRKPDNHALLQSVYELPPDVYMTVVSHALPFIDQSVSLTMYLPDDEKEEFQCIANWIFRTWRLGFKTAMYYCRMHPVSKAINVHKARPITCMTCCE